jgi:multisubunit Na+/H+ antiporter MnhE subunit
MAQFFRKQLTIFLVGFVIAFVIYLFVRFNSADVILGVVIAAGVGVLGNVGLHMLARRFPEQVPGADTQAKR